MSADGTTSDRELSVLLGLAAGGVHAFGDPFGPLGGDMTLERREALEEILAAGWAYITGRSDAGWALVISDTGRRALADRCALSAELAQIAAGGVHLAGDLFPVDDDDDPDDVAEWKVIEHYVATCRAYVHGPCDIPLGWPVALTPAPRAGRAARTADQLDDLTVDAVVVALLGEAERVEAAHIIHAAVRAGLMWRCRFKHPNHLSRASCVECADPRPQTPPRRPA